ncbi:hypothetical protein CORC01_05310 [Colletotrichum orchidophilum]|uniref:Bulb-type lectin domain-containing protein n=1 Tax=Colletotrichum orchidophilum TaxID=1209926 RepID=A0A1G4BCX0_9PEZI|nr:uncharacterized protein CORC01_05310 [Colletotrichum orchidophilum]OHE99269.1 hypothetical protein CORC01_05310 [Colletotrichum orchidophilum]
MQGDDSLVIQPTGQEPCWASNTPQNNGGGTAELIVEDRGTAVIKSNNVVRWCTNGDFVQEDFSSYFAIPAGSDRVRPNLSRGQALVSGNKQFSAMILSDETMMIQYNPLNLVVWSVASPAGRKAAKVAVDGGLRLSTYTADDRLVWKGNRDDYWNSSNDDFVMQDDGVLSFWGDDSGQSLITGSARLTIESNGMLTFGTDGGSTKKYLYLIDDSGKCITNCSLATLSGDGCLELLDIKFQSLWKNPKQEVEDFSRAEYRSRTQRVDPAFRICDGGVFECNEE